MRMYPAIRSKMGTWNYYMVRMKMREIAHEVQLAHDIYEDKTLSDAVQRILSEQRVKKHIVGYLAGNKDRFFSSIVVAAMEGEPTWTPIELNEDIIPAVFANMSAFRESFGVLSFGDDPKYYALDGQHRVAAIKLLVGGETEWLPPENFDEDYMSVIVVLREENDVPEGQWMRRYRRLFSSLNRYAKPTDADTNIIMDEDDLFAIVTRGLITEHEFFKAPGREQESFRVQTKGKNIRNTSHFTSLQALYAVNEILLTTRTRQVSNWMPEGNKQFKQFRPEENFIDSCSGELHHYWDAILKTLPDLRKDPLKMRCHDDEAWDGQEYQDHLLFLPIGQELIAPIVREILDNRFPEKGYGSVSEMVAALAPLRTISWELRDPPWRHLLLIPGSDPQAWKVRNEERKEALKVAGNLLRWMLRLDPLDADGLEELHKSWLQLLYPEAERKAANEMWEKVIATREKIVAP